MGKITYADKEALNEIPSIADKNKCKASDMNEIKNVVNNLLPDISSQTAPQNPVLNDLWIDTDDENVLVQVDNTVSTTSTNAVQNQAITNYVDGTVLYNNTTGSETNIVLNDSAANYSRIKVFYKNRNDCYNSIEIDNPNGKKISLQTREVIYANNQYYDQTCNTSYNISGTNMTLAYYDLTNFQNGTYPSVDTSSNRIAIYKVIGYNY